MGGASKFIVVVVPGIGGSELVDDDMPPEKRRVWYAHRRSLVDALIEPERLDVERPLRPVGLLSDFTIIPWFKSIDGYSKLWTQVRGAVPGARYDSGNPGNRDPDATVVAFPYDFRLGVEHASQRLSTELGDRLRRHGDDANVVLVAHSMGGLIARHWVATSGQADRCRGVITLGTPHRGAPKALDVLANGLYWGSRLVQHPALSQVVQRWPGLHDLVGVDNRIIDTSDGSATRRAAHQLSGFDQLPALQSAAKVHAAIRSWWTDTDPQTTPILIPYAGAGSATACRAMWNGKRISISRDPLDDEPFGDSTVPYWSAVPQEWGGPAATQRVTRVAKRHGELSSPPGLRSTLESLLGADPPKRGGDNVADTFGMDLADLVEPGEALVGRLLLDDRPCDLASRLVRATFTDDAGDSTELPVEYSLDGQFSIAIPERDGDVSVHARVDLDEDTRLATRDRVAVVG